MASFGSFETEREAYSDLVYTVYTARRHDDANGEYAVKVFRLPDPGLEAEVAVGARGRDELEHARLESIDVQQHASQQSRFVAPVLERGNDSRGVWYCTRFYPRSINRMMSGKVALPRASLEYLIRSIAQGALDLKRSCGRSHGEIQPTNVQIGKSEKLTDAEVVLCDPLPGGPEQADAYELSDLQAIGWILLQLVRQRTLDKQDAALMFPIAPGPEWTSVFGSDASDWLAVCNRLLNPNLALSQFNLEALLTRLQELEPKRGGSPRLMAIACGVAVLVIFVGLWAFRPRRVSVDHTINSPGAKANTNAVSNQQTPRPKPPLSLPPPVAETPKPTETPLVAKTESPTVRAESPPVAPVVSTGEIEFRAEPVAASIFDAAGNELGQVSSSNPLIRTVPSGKALFVARADGLKDVSSEVTITPGAKAQHTFTFDYGTVEWASEPATAMIQLGARSQNAPATFIQQPDTTNTFIITAPGYVPQTNYVSVKTGERRKLVARLMPQSTAVSLISDPPGAEYFTEDGTPLARDKGNSTLFSIPRGLRKVVARHPQLGTLTNKIETTTEGGTPLRFNFAYGMLVLTNLPANVVLYEGATRIGAATEGGVYQQPGTHQYTLRGPGTSQDAPLTIQPGMNYLRLATSEKSWKNNIGMSFAWVPNLPGGGAWPGQPVPGGWVGISEVTQGQYKRMDGSNPSVYRDGGDSYPVENVTWDQAMNYCRWLTSIGASECGGWRYTLPSDEQFNAFGADADRVARVTAEGRMTSALDDAFPAQRMPRIPAQQNLNNARTHPEPVASTKQPNQYGLYDVVGNVWEWLGGAGAKDNWCAGGSYLNFSQKTVGVRAREKTSQKAPSIGFRVILVPPQ